MPFPISLQDATAWRAGAPLPLYIYNLPQQEQHRLEVLLNVMRYFGASYPLPIRPAIQAQWNRLGARLLEIMRADETGGWQSVDLVLEWVRSELPVSLVTSLDARRQGLQRAHGTRRRRTLRHLHRNAPSPVTLEMVAMVDRGTTATVRTSKPRQRVPRACVV